MRGNCIVLIRPRKELESMEDSRLCESIYRPIYQFPISECQCQVYMVLYPVVPGVIMFAGLDLRLNKNDTSLNN